MESPRAQGWRLSCSTICFRRFPLRDALEASRSLGFGWVDIGALPGFCEHLDFVRGEDSRQQEAERLILDSGLRVNTFTLSIGHPNDPAIDPGRALAAGLRAIDAATRLGAAGVNFNCGVYRDRARHPLAADIDRVAAVLRPLASACSARGLSFMIEAPHKGNLIRTPDEAVQLLAACAAPQARLVLDVNHHHAAGWTPRRSVTFLGARRIGIVHLRDAIGRENQYPLGTGEIDVAELLGALREAGYEGVLAFEFTDAAATLEGNLVVLRQSLAYLRSRIQAVRPSSP